MEWGGGRGGFAMAAVKGRDIPALGQTGISSGDHLSFLTFGKGSPAKP